MNTTTKSFIVCPTCGMQYTPSEIYYPGDLIGKQTNIIRDDDGKIIYYQDNDICLNQEFICDHCGSAFTINADIVYSTKSCKEHDFDDDYVTKIKK